MHAIKKSFEQRIHPRHLYSGDIYFVTKNQLFKGLLKNYSRHGLFIKTPEILTLGEFITVALPYMDDKDGKVMGQIIWQNREGYGVELVRKRNGASINLLKLEARSKHMNKTR